MILTPVADHVEPFQNSIERAAAVVAVPERLNSKWSNLLIDPIYR
jgi:hypothetical protein